MLLQTELQWGLYAFVFVAMMYFLPALNLKHTWRLGLSGKVPTSDARGGNTPPHTHTQLLHKQGTSKARVKQRYKDKEQPVFIVC